MKQEKWQQIKQIFKHFMTSPHPRVKFEFINAVPAEEEAKQMRDRRKKSTLTVPDREGHYDIDGVSYEHGDGVVVATEPRPKTLEIRFSLH